jgi:hypothetical protein
VYVAIATAWRRAASQIWVPKLLTASRSLFGLKTTPMTPAVELSTIILDTGAKLCASHQVMMPSAPPETQLPSGLTATLKTSPV